MEHLAPGGAFSLAIGYGWILIGAAVFAATIGRRFVQVALSAPALALTPTLSRVLSRFVRTRSLTGDEFFAADGAEAPWVATRRAALDRLQDRLAGHSDASNELGNVLRDSVSDLRFADANRVPFPFAKEMRERFNLCTVAVESKGPHLRDLDDRWSLDISGSYGVNVAGYERYKEWLTEGWDRVRALGPVLGPLHPVVADNVSILKALSNKQEVSFHVSGTEAVMAAVRLARFNTRRETIVCFSGAYHGWWDGVQPGIGSERNIDDCLTLKDMHAASLSTIRRRAGEIAAVLVNPVQSFHPNSPPPNDAVLLSSELRSTRDTTSDYAKWLAELRRVCTECDVPLIFDEVYSGFRLAPGGAQAFYGIDADMVLYGKTVAGGMPIGVVCGSKALMRRFDPDHPMRIAYVVGTFSAHPLAMGAMNAFLNWVTTEAARAEYREANERCAAWVADVNGRCVAEELPIQIANLGTIWTVQFTEPSRYNWLLQYYLRAEGLNLSWVGTGRCLVSLDFTNEDFNMLTDKLLAAVRQAKADKWWLTETEQPHRERTIRRNLARDLAASVVRLPAGLKTFYTEVMRRKHDDHVASHSDRTNQFLHLVSSSVFIFCYGLIFTDLVTAMWLGLGALCIRQIGHALIEPPCHDKEQLLLGFDTRSKTLIVAGYLGIPLYHCLMAPALNTQTLPSILAVVAVQWFAFTALVVLGRVVLLVFRHGPRNAMIWFVKLVTDPFTDIVAYYPSAIRTSR